MFSKNLRYYRLKNSMSRAELAKQSGLTPMAITNYENGTRNPSMEVLKSLATVLGVKISDFLAVRNENIVFSHGEFRKVSTMSQAKQDYVREVVEEYFGRFYPITGDVEEDAHAMRRHLGIAEEGPIKDLITILENKGILVYVCEIENSKFSGMNGLVNDRPYIIVNGSMTPERNRSTIAHELAHLFFDWPDDLEEKEIEDTATAISGAFLFPKADAIRELGVHRGRVTKDMTLVCREYGISMLLLVMRAQLIGIITKEAYKSFYIQASKIGWRTNEPSRIEKERPELFEQLVFRAVSEGEISIQRGAELLQMPYAEVVSHCCFNEG